MPKTCQKQFSSFGSEMKARAEIKKHIYEHLGELEEEGIALFSLIISYV